MNKWMINYGISDRDNSLSYLATKVIHKVKEIKKKSKCSNTRKKYTWIFYVISLFYTSGLIYHIVERCHRNKIYLATSLAPIIYFVLFWHPSHQKM